MQKRKLRNMNEGKVRNVEAGNAWTMEEVKLLNAEKKLLNVKEGKVRNGGGGRKVVDCREMKV